MLSSYFKTALRFLWKQKAYSFINVLGLAVGLACSFFILVWVQDELGYDRFHDKGERLYRMMRNAYFSDGQVYTWQAITKPLAQVLEDEYPEIEHVVMMSWGDESLVARGDQSFRERGYHAGTAFFEIFSFPLVAGEAATVLDDPNGIVISETLARKHFGEDWQARGQVLGQTLRVADRQDFTVTGVFADFPRNTTFEADFVLSIEDFYRNNPWVEHWGNSGLQMYVLLADGADRAAVDEKIRNVINEHNEGSNSQIFLQPLGDVRLYSDFEDGKLAGGRIEYVRMFVVVAVFILLIASINFMNLATARSGQRAREIGVRKSVGATQRALVVQFLGESVLMAVLALVLSVGLVAAGLPGFNALTEKAVSLGTVGAPMALLFAGLALGTGLLAGSYPALYLSSFNVISVLRGTLGRRSGSAGLRKGLVVFQFAMSILLIVGTLTIYRQIDFIRNKNLGLDRENVVFLPFEGGVRAQYEAFRQELSQRPGIASVTTSSQNPLNVGSSTTDPAWEGKDPESEMLFHIINASHDFVETMKMRVVQGRSFSRAHPSDSMNYVVNQATARAMGMENPVGQQLTFWGQTGEIVGVVEDFHMQSLYAPIEPTILRLDPQETWNLFVRTQAGQTEEGLASLEAVFKQFNPGYPFTYTFLDANFEETYKSEQVIGQLARVFAVLAIFIACLGLFGLASFTAEQRTKEIGIRKVLGASVSGLVLLLSRDFIKLVVVAFVLTVPVAYYLMESWLGNFAYHIEIEARLFVIAGVVAVVIAWLTVGYQSIRTAVANPVKALRTE